MVVVLKSGNTVNGRSEKSKVAVKKETVNNQISGWKNFGNEMKKKESESSSDSEEENYSKPRCPEKIEDVSKLQSLSEHFSQLKRKSNKPLPKREDIEKSSEINDVSELQSLSEHFSQLKRNSDKPSFERDEFENLSEIKDETLFKGPIKFDIKSKFPRKTEKIQTFSKHIEIQDKAPDRSKKEAKFVVARNAIHVALGQENFSKLKDDKTGQFSIKVEKDIENFAQAYKNNSKLDSIKFDTFHPRFLSSLKEREGLMDVTSLVLAASTIKKHELNEIIKSDVTHIQKFMDSVGWKF